MIAISTTTGLYAAAAALGITTAGLSFIELSKKVSQKGGDKYRINWEKLTTNYISESSKAAAAENATERLDEGERNRLNNLANQNAENSNVLAPHYAEKATEKLDAKRTADEQREENSMQTVNTPLYTPNGQQNYDENTGLSIPSIEDETNNNVETEVPLRSTEEWIKLIQDAQKAQWERDDAKQAHIEEREDSAYQRAVADARKAGINPNLINITPAESGGGFTASQGMDFSPVTTQMNNEIKGILDEIEKNFQGGQNEKDRIKDLITSLGQMAMMYFAISSRGGKGG